MPLFAFIDPYILAFSALTVLLTIALGFWSARRSRTAHDFFVAGRSVSVGWNASAISGEYLSAASFMGVAGMVMSSGYDALWYPVGYACGYLFLLLFIAGPLRRFGAYTIPDFAEGRYDSPVFRKIAVVFVLFIGFFYTMPQMKGAGTTLAYIFPGLPYWAGVVLVGAVITLNVALGGMKGITLVQAFQYWAKLFAISVPVFVLMAVYGHYGKQLGVQQSPHAEPEVRGVANLGEFGMCEAVNGFVPYRVWGDSGNGSFGGRPLTLVEVKVRVKSFVYRLGHQPPPPNYPSIDLVSALYEYARATREKVWVSTNLNLRMNLGGPISIARNNREADARNVEKLLATRGILIKRHPRYGPRVAEAGVFSDMDRRAAEAEEPKLRGNTLLERARAGGAEPVSGGLTSNGESAYDRGGGGFSLFNEVNDRYGALTLKGGLRHLFDLLLQREGYGLSLQVPTLHYGAALLELARFRGWQILTFEPMPNITVDISRYGTRRDFSQGLFNQLATNGVSFVLLKGNRYLAFPTAKRAEYEPVIEFLGGNAERKPLPTHAPPDDAWLNPFGPLTTKAATAAAQAVKTNVTMMSDISLPATIATNTGVFKFINVHSEEILDVYAAVTGYTLLPRKTGLLDKLDEILRGQLTRLHLRQPISFPPALINAQSDRPTTRADLKTIIEACLATNSISLVAVGEKYFRAVRTAELEAHKADLVKNAQQRWIDTHQRPLALLYTYSLIIALVCGTAGLPHLLVRFYTNPDGAAAKRTTMWVMILIGVFYLFPPIFGALGRNLLPELYGAAGAMGTDKIVLELPRILNERYGALGSILSGITCAGAFAAFMSTFSGLLVSMTGALAHDVYGRMLRPSASPKDRLRAFKVCAVVIGGIAILLGMQVEPLQINFMVGQAFAIAAASYFPLLFMSAWWRGMTMRGAATGMLTGGLLALTVISLTSFSDLKWLPLDAFWAAHPLARILCEQPAIWAVPLAIGLMVGVSKLTRQQVPADVRMKMLVLHAPEKLGLKQEYIREHQPGH